MKKLILLGVFAITLGTAFFVPVASAATFGASDSYALRAGETLHDDLYVAGGSATLIGNIDGDLHAGALNVFMNDDVSEDAYLVGGTTDILGSVGKTLHVVSGKTLFHGTVGADLVTASESLQILPGSTIAGNVYFAAGSATIEGTTTGSVQGVGGAVTLNGTVLGNVNITASTLTIGPNAHIAGTLNYASSKPASIAADSQILGATTYTQVDTRSGLEKLIPTLWGTWIIIKFVILLFSALVIQGVFRSITPIFVHTAVEAPLWSIVRGFLIVIGIPLAAVLVILTFVGIPFVVLGLSLYTAFLVLAYLFSPIIAGAYLYQFLNTPHEIKVHWKSIVVGVVAVMILAPLGLFGTIVQALLFLLSLGAIFHVLFARFVRARE